MSRPNDSADSIGFRWWIYRNPLYLLSAAAMALGARQLLVHPDAAAGEVGLILATLVALQLYECAVSGVLILLQRHRKSPEDLPSLLLVAALFWTGPLAATVEMTARHGTVGLGFATAAGLIALGELRVVRQILGLRFSPWTAALAAACILLLAAAPLKLHIPYETEGTDETALYVCWWILAGIVLLTLGGLAWHLKRIDAGANADAISARRDLKLDLLFSLAALAATATHLWGMNYAFFGNAAPFYITPVLCAMTVVWFEYLARRGIRGFLAWMPGLLLPACGVWLSRAGFHEKVIVTDWPLLFRDPLLTALTLAMIAWSYGVLRRGPVWLIHAGVADVILWAIRASSGSTASLQTGDLGHTYRQISHDWLAALFFGLTAYLLVIAWLRRSRWEAPLALATTWIGSAYLLHGRIAGDQMVLSLLFGWLTLAAVHIAWKRPAWRARLPVLLLLMAINGTYLRDPDLRQYAAFHAAAMSAGLFAIGWFWPWTRYRTVAVLYACMLSILGGGRWIYGHEHAQAIAAITAAFGLLCLGLLVSWHKARWLENAPVPLPELAVEIPPEVAGEQAAAPDADNWSES